MTKLYNYAWMFILAILMATGGAKGYAATEEPIITIHSTAYQEVGESNKFSLFISSYDTDYFDVDLGYGANEVEVTNGTFDSSTGEWEGTWIPIRATEEGIIKIYGNPENLNIIKLDGGYVKEIEMSKCVNLQILSLQHNVLENLDLTPHKWLQAVYLSDNPFTGDTSIVMGADHPNLTILELDIIDKMGEGFDLRNYPELISFDAYHNMDLHWVDTSNCPKLSTLCLEMTDVASLDVSNNMYLRSLNIAETRITDIDVTCLPYLQMFIAGHDSGWINQGYRLNSIDLTKNPELFYLNLSGNYLGSIDLSQNTKLYHVQVNRNGLTSIDLSGKPDLYSVSLNFNDMDYATLPLPQPEWGEYYYIQNPLGLPKAIAEGADIDLSARVLREGTTTSAVVWVAPVGAQDYVMDATGYTYSKGIVKFNTCPSDSVYIEYVNDAFADYTLKTSKFKVKKASEMGQPSKVMGLTLGDNAVIKLSIGMSGATPLTPKTFYLELEPGKLTEFVTTFADEPTGHNVNVAAPQGFNGTVNVYMPEDEVLTSFSADDMELYSAMLNQATELRYLSLNNCNLFTVDLAYNRCLKYLDVSNNNLEVLDLRGIYGNYAKNVLFTVKASHNKLKNEYSFMFDDTKTFRHLDLSYNELNNFDLMEFENLDYVDLSHNQLSEELYITYQITASHIDLSYNQLPSVVMDYFENISYMNLSHNNFTFNTLPLPSDINATSSYIYAPQNEYQLPKSAPAVNLTDMYRVVRGKATNFVWMTEGGQVLTSEEVDCQEGASKFLKFDMGPIYCKMTHTAFPAFTGDDVYKTTLVNPVDAPTALVASFTTVNNSNKGEVIFTGSRNTELYIDWRGDGSEYTVYPVETSYISYPDQTTYAGAEVKVYTYDDPDAITVFSIYGIAMSEADFSPLTKVTCLNIGNAGLTPENLKLPENAPITELGFPYSKFTEFPYADKYPDLYMLNMAGNQLYSFDASPMKNLQLLTLSSNQLSDVKFDNPKLWSLSLELNKFKSIDLNGLPSLYQVFLTGNELSEIDIEPVKESLMVLAIGSNKFTFSTLPLPSAYPKLMNYTYGNQAMLEGVLEGDKVDLSQAASAGGVDSQYVWYLGEAVYDTTTLEWTGETLVEGEEYSIENGVTTFFYPYDDSVMCLVTNELFPNLTMKSNLISLKDLGVDGVALDGNEPVNVYTLEGTVVKKQVKASEALEGLTPGFYIVGSKKVIVK